MYNGIITIHIFVDPLIIVLGLYYPIYWNYHDASWEFQFSSTTAARGETDDFEHCPRECKMKTRTNIDYEHKPDRTAVSWIYFWVILITTSLFSLTGNDGFYREIIPFYGRKVQVGELL